MGNLLFPIIKSRLRTGDEGQIKTDKMTSWGLLGRTIFRKNIDNRS